MPDLTLKCRLTGKDFVVTEWEQEFLNKMDFPLPDLCIDERHRRRLAYRNERQLYKSKCALSGKSIISIYAPDSPYTVYCQEEWWGDKWDERDYGKEFDFSRGFFEQFNELNLAVPRLALMNVKAENSEYCNITNSNKNCYLVFGGDFNEDCLYNIFSFYSKDSSDLYWVDEAQLCYELIDSKKCYNCKYSQNAINCSDSSFLFECRGCRSCFGCVGLRNKEYHIFNKAYSKEDYENKIKEFSLHTNSGVNRMKKEFDVFRLKFPHRAADITSCENCTGDRIFEAKNCHNCFDVHGKAEDMKDCMFAGYEAKDMLSCDHAGFKAELFYEMLGSIDGVNCAFCGFSWNSSDIYYSYMIVNNCHDLFGCSNMKKASYCILNKQYSKEDYFEMRARIVEHMKKTGEWGQYFPMTHSPFAYNDTVAHDLYPMIKSDALNKGLKWHDEEVREVGSGAQVPDSIDDVSDEILSVTFVCDKSGTPYRITPEELALYRRLRVPIPHFCQETRNKMRMLKRKPANSWHRKCDKCGVDVTTSYSPESPEIIYCEPCYLKGVF